MISHYPYQKRLWPFCLSLSPSPLLWCQQHLFRLYVTLPLLLCQPGSALRVWHHYLYGRVPVCRRFRHECGNLCAIHTVWLHLLRQILPCKRPCGTLRAVTVCVIVWWCNLISSFLSSLSIHPAAEGEVCDWRLFTVLWMQQHRCCVPTQDLPE